MAGTQAAEARNFSFLLTFYNGIMRLYTPAPIHRAIAFSAKPSPRFLFYKGVSLTLTVESVKSSWPPLLYVSSFFRVRAMSRCLARLSVRKDR